MKISVYNDEKNKNEVVSLQEKATVADLLKKLTINPVTVIVTRKNTLLTSQEKLQDKDEIKILSVVSGG